LRSGRVKGYDAHHINTVKGNPNEMARNPNNIRFVTRAEHIQIHRAEGGFRSPIAGRPLIGRVLGWFDSITIFTGTLSGRIRTDSFDNFWADVGGYESVGDAIEREKKFCKGIKYVGVPCA
jgi:hypothetical protein